MGDSSSITRAMSTHNGSKNVSQLTLLSHPSGNVGNKYFGMQLIIHDGMKGENRLDLLLTNQIA